MISALFKFANNPYDGCEVDTTSNSGQYRGLSPFVLPAPPARNFENLWQFSKVYRHHLWNGEPSQQWYEWRDKGFSDIRAHRYPMGKGAKPEYSFWNGEKLGYIEARKKIYAKVYSENVILTEGFSRLKSLYQRCLMDGQPLILRDYDAYDHIELGMSLKEVINNPSRKMGHAFVLIMMLTNELAECMV